MTQGPTLIRTPAPLPPSDLTPESCALWSQAPYGLLRVAGLSQRSLTVLDTPATRGAVKEYLALDRQLRAGREHLSAQLSRQVRRVVAQPALLRATIHLRRALYSGKAVRSSDAELALPALPGPLRRLTQRTFSRLRRQQALKVEFGSALAQDRRRVSAELRRLLRDQPQFLAALETVNGTLSDSLQLYLGPDPPPRDWRKLELTLLAYIMRASVKTSPLSRLAWNILTTLAAPPPSTPLKLHTSQLTSHVTVHSGVVRRLFQAAQSHPALSPHWLYAVNPDLEVSSSGVRGARRAYGAQVTDQLFALERVGVAKLLITLRQAGPLSHAKLLAVLSARLGGDEIAAEAMFAQLRDQQLLVSATTPRDDAEPIAQLITLLMALDTDEGRVLSALLRQLQRELVTYSRSDAAERRHTQRELIGLLNAFVGRCQQPAAQWPRRLLYENTGTLSTSACLPVLDELVCRGLATLATLFDAQTQTTLDRTAAFIQRYHNAGRCHEPLHFWLTATPGEPAAAAEVLTDADRLALAQLDARREQLRLARHDLIDLLLNQRHLNQMTVELDWLEKLRQRRALRWPTRSISVFLQRGAGYYVLNGLSSGHAALFLRHVQVADAGQALQQQIAHHLQQTWPEGQVVQLVPNSESSVNRIPRLLPQVLALPSTSQSEPGEWRVRDVHLRHDPRSNEVQFFTRTGRIIPLYLGTLTGRFLAPIDRAVAASTPSLAYQSAVLTELETRSGERHVPRHWPRVMLGPVVIVRQSWVLDPVHLPQRRSTDDDFAYWCALQRWQAEHGIPDRFFAHSFEAWRKRASNDDQSQESFAKPHYFDLNQYHFVRLFERWTADLNGTWCLQEVDPDVPGEVELDGERHVAEFCCELSLGEFR